MDKSGRALTEADQLGLFIFTSNAAGETVIRHSLRLKAFREAQQLIEHLALLERRLGWNREETRAFVRHHVDLAGSVAQANADDAGTPGFAALSAPRLAALREATLDLLRRAPATAAEQ